MKTHILNALHILLYYGERYMIRTLNQISRELGDPKIAAQVRWFSVQEAEHASEHRRFWEVLQREGFRIDAFSRFCNWVGETLLPRYFPRKLNLATSVAIEHNTSVFADAALRFSAFESMHPEARRLIEWHCAEEIEHKAVVFDVLNSVSKRSYAWRVAGMAMAVFVLGAMTAVGALMLLLQDPRAWRPALARDFIELFFTREALLTRGLRLGVAYFRRDFHPDQIDSRELAEAVLGRKLQTA